jgi:dihydroxy-acid dehydratase
VFGNLAPNGSVLKTGAVHPNMHQFRGPAVIFESEESAAAGAAAGGPIAFVEEGDTICIDIPN